MTKVANTIELFCVYAYINIYVHARHIRNVLCILYMYFFAYFSPYFFHIFFPYFFQGIYEMYITRTLFVPFAYIYILYIYTFCIYIHFVYIYILCIYTFCIYIHFVYIYILCIYTKCIYM